MTGKRIVFSALLLVAAVAFEPSSAARPCVTAEASPVCEPPKLFPCVEAWPSPRCSSPKHSPCVRAAPSPRCPSSKPSPCVMAEPSPKPSPCVKADPSPCVRAQPSPKPSACVRVQPSPKQSLCVKADPSLCVGAEPSPCVRAEPSPRCSSPQPSPCVKAYPSPCVKAQASPRCQPRAQPSPVCKPKCKTVMSILQSRPPCTTSLFLQLVQAAGMEAVFEQAKAHDATIFVPTNQAIESTLAFLGMDLDYILTKEVAQEILNYHIAENRQVAAYQVQWNGVFLYTRNYWAERVLFVLWFVNALYLYRDGAKGDIAVVSAQTDAHLILDDADNQNVNIKTCSGIVHFVDALLMPTSVVEQFKQSKH